MSTFSFVLLIGVMAFSDAFGSIDKILEIKGLIEPRELPEDADWYELFFQSYVISW
jgi:hypothetical protein